MSATNDVTGDRLVSKSFSEQGGVNFDTIFGKKKTNGGWKYVPETNNERDNDDISSNDSTNV